MLGWASPFHKVGKGKEVYSCYWKARIKIQKEKFYLIMMSVVEKENPKF